MKTGARGEYSVGDIDRLGTWLVSATAPPSLDPPESSADRRLGWAQTFYSGATDPHLAAKIPMQPGGDLRNLDIRLVTVPVHQVRGRVLDAAGNPAPNATVTWHKGLGPKLDQVTRSDGTFAFASVPEGESRLTVTSDRDGVRMWAGESIEVKGRDAEPAELSLTPPITLHGKRVGEAPEGVPAPPAAPDVVLAYDAGALGHDNSVPSLPIGHADEKGDFTLRVYPGPYHLFVLGPETTPYYLDSIRLGNLDALAAQDIPILSGATPLLVTFQYGGGSVRGTVESCGTGRVLLIPIDSLLRRVNLACEPHCLRPKRAVRIYRGQAGRLLWCRDAGRHCPR